MKQRIISAFIGVILLFVVMGTNKIVFDIAVTLISCMAIYEVLSALGLKGHRTMTSTSLLMPVVIMLMSHFAKENMLAVVFFFLALYLLLMLFFHNSYTFTDVVKFFTVAVMISLSFIHLSYIRRMDHGIICVFFVFIGSWITDTCAYFTGVAIGKHKLAPSISPKKTIEGSVGGILGVTVIITAYAAVCANIINMKANIPSVIIIGILCGVLSQFGDLCASIIKRENSVKDFGNIMPGHGGVMDRFDSFLFVAPVVYYILEYFPVFS